MHAYAAFVACHTSVTRHMGLQITALLSNYDHGVKETLGFEA